MVDMQKPSIKSPDQGPDTYIDDDGTGIELEDTSSDGKITEPFDPTLIRVETKPMTIDLLLARMREGELDLTPGFQRKGGIWKDEAQSRLIESILIRIPLPAFYMDATDENKWLVVDGLQRLTTLKRFVLDKKLRLCGLEFLVQLHGKTFDNLPRNFQRRIAETQVTVYLIEKGTPSGVKFNIFKRINTGGLPLSAQEIRHALNQGKVTEFLERLANLKDFKEATANSIRDDRMADRECVLRFLAFTITSYEEYKVNDLDSFLNERMAEINNMSDQRLDILEQKFIRAMRAMLIIFGREAFRKPRKGNTPRFPINKALFESWSVNISQLDDHQILELTEEKEVLKEKFLNLMDDREFNDAISQGTGNINKVKHRFRAIEDLILEVLS